MIDSPWSETKPWIISATCWMVPGFSTFKENRTSRKKTNSSPSTSSSMANVSVMGACGLYGWTCTACITWVARLPKYSFNVAVMGSNSCIPVDQASRGPAAEQSNSLNEEGDQGQGNAQ